MQIKSIPALRKRDKKKDEVKQDCLALINIKDNSA